jgi:2-polyprenyl-3-methyl-5-hydroxy-6-metoxy-1,4-benzoquinol methylase
MAKTAVFIIKGDDFKGIEGETAVRVMKLLLGEGNRPPDIFELDKDGPFRTGDLHAYKGYDVFVILSGILFITSEGVSALAGIARKRKEVSVIAPVSNESRISYQRCAPPFFYQTLSVFRWAAEKIHREFKDTVKEVDETDEYGFAFRRELLEVLPDDRNLLDLPGIMKQEGLKCGIAKGIYAHRYGNSYESSRDDLIEHVPLRAQKILDVGSARGLFGALLKKRQKCEVTGVDRENEMIVAARDRLDNVICGDIEEILDKGILGQYDCIVCGDVLEHLNNPWKVVKGLKNHLKKEGLCIASLPNIMNWAIIFEQLQGRWDYVPFSILSGTHIRFFTRNTGMKLFEDSGYRIRETYLQSLEIPPRGKDFILKLKDISPAAREEELRASEIIIVAEC